MDRARPLARLITHTQGTTVSQSASPSFCNLLMSEAGRSGDSAKHLKNWLRASDVAQKSSPEKLSDSRFNRRGLERCNQSKTIYVAAGEHICDLAHFT